MGADSVLARLAENPELPSPPALALRVMERANRANSSIAEIGKIISHDPALCGKILRLVNSSLFGLQSPVTSLDRALNLLGLNHLRSLVLSLSLPFLQSRRVPSEQMKTYWKSSVTMAVVCRGLAQRINLPDPDSEMVGGLLCDLGTLLLHAAFPEPMAVVSAYRPEILFQRQCELERTHVGVDHAETAAYFLKRWSLGDDLTEAIRFHHEPTRAPAAYVERAALLHFATLVSLLQNTPDASFVVGEIVAVARESFHLDHDELLTLLDSLTPQIDEFAALLDVDVGPRESFSELYAKATDNLAKLALAASLDSLRAQEEKSQVEQRLTEARESLRMSEEQLRHAQKMESIGRLAGGIAHDFNNLLTVIIGNCELLAELPALDKQAAELISMIRHSGQRAAELTRQLLAFSRRQQLAPEIMSLNTVVANMTKLVDRVIGKDIQLVTHLAEELPLVKVDPGQIEQVILNLTVNARDAMADGGTLTLETFRMELDAELIQQNEDMKPGDYAVLSVRDTGCGMDAPTLRRAFEPFFTTKERGKGTGLGLATVHGIIRQSGGHITVSSALGHGTVFHIYLPAASEKPSSENTHSPPSSSSSGSETVLIVESENDVREFTRRTLVLQGYRVLTARNGPEALELVDGFEDAIHVVVTDEVMPRMSGKELIERLVARRPALKVIYLSGSADRSSPRENEDARSASLLQKPFSTRKLTELIREVLDCAVSV